MAQFQRRKPSGGRRPHGRGRPQKKRHPKKGGGRPKGRGRPPRGRGSSPSLSKAERQVYKKAQAIQKKNGIPFVDALEIAARGTNVDPRRFQKEKKADSKLEELVKEFKLPRSLAGNVVSGNITLDKAILRNQMKKHLDANRFRSCLADAMSSEEDITLRMAGLKSMTGRVMEVGDYSFRFKRTPKGKRQTKTIEYPKLHVLYGYAPAFEDFVEGRRSEDEDLRGRKEKPPRRIVDRRMVKNEKLQRYLMKRLPLVLKTYDGDIFRGRLTWWGQYEMGVDLGNGVVVTFFRHGVFLIYQH